MKHPLLVDTQWLHGSLDNSEIEIIENAWVTASGCLAQGRPISSRLEAPAVGSDIISEPFSTDYINCKR